MCIRDRFADGQSTNLSRTLQEDSLAKLSTDSSLKLQFSKLQLADFWLYAMTDYPELGKRVLKLSLIHI